MIRAFVGVRLDPEVTGKISEAQLQLRSKLPGVRWVARENLHFTIKFLGSVAEEKIGPIMEALEQPVRAVQRFSVAARGIGVFPGVNRPRVLWVGLQGEALAGLVSGVERALEPLGFARERRAFQPHLTIGRWRNPGNSSAGLGREIESRKEREFGASWVEE
ncbi:MAG: RNA 2',3'-cyclic phosphodiesterase, partial [Deltaproteobacteria bacterium]|nr:RNA 2',3'-cyclic phosphodiesterase [Deltaproteobacteria bacterium]